MKTCGGCKWFPIGEVQKGDPGQSAADCQSPAPMWAAYSMDRDPMVFAYDTADRCAMFEPREGASK